MQPTDVDPLLRDLATAAASDEGCELIDLHLRRHGRRSLIELTVDRPGGVTLDDCARVSRGLSRALDEAGTDPFPGSWRLEVGSPGLTRRLHRPDDYRRFRGRLARLELHAPIAGHRRLRGIIVEVADDDTVSLHPDSEDHPIAVPWDAITRGRLDFDPATDAAAGHRTRPRRGRAS